MALLSEQSSVHTEYQPVWALRRESQQQTGRDRSRQVAGGLQDPTVRISSVSVNRHYQFGDVILSLGLSKTFLFLV